MSSNLKAGIIIKMINFQVIKYSCERNLPQYSVISCTNMKLIGFYSKLIEICNNKIKKVPNKL